MAKIIQDIYSNIGNYNPISNTGNYFYGTDTKNYYIADGAQWLLSTPSPEDLAVLYFATSGSGGGSGGGSLPALGSSLYSGQITAGTTAQALPSQALTNGAVVTNLTNNPLYVGGSGVTTSTGFQLAANSSVSLAVSNASVINFISPSGTTGKIAYIAY